MYARMLTPDEYAQWDELASEAPAGCIFDESRWFTAVAEATGVQVEVAGVFDRDDQLAGGCVLAVRSRFGLKTAGLPPLCHTNTCLVSRFPSGSKSKRQQHLLDVSACLARFLKSKFSYSVITNHARMTDIRGLRWEGWRTHVLYSFLVDLSSLALENMGKSVRRQIRHAERTGVVIVDDADPDLVFRLLCKTGERQGFEPDASWAALGAMRERVGSALRLKVATLGEGGEPAAALVTVLDEPRSTVYALLAGFDPEYAQYHAAALTHWREMQVMRERGFSTYDFMGADVPSNVRFKASFGGEVTPYFQVSCACPGYRVVNWILRRKWIPTRWGCAASSRSR